MVAGEERRVDARIDALHHTPWLARPGYHAHAVVPGQLVEEEIAHGPMRIVDEHPPYAGLTRTLDRRGDFARHVAAIDGILVRVARIALPPGTDSRRSLHVPGNEKIHW